MSEREAVESLRDFVGYIAPTTGPVFNLAFVAAKVLGDSAFPRGTAQGLAKGAKLG